MVFLFLIEFYKGKFKFLKNHLMWSWFPYIGYGGLLFPPNVWGLEMASICIFFLLQMMRLDLGNRANRNEHCNATKFFMIFTFLALLFYAYFALYTTYVLTVDIGFGLIGFFFAFMEILIAIPAYFRFKKYDTYWRKTSSEVIFN